MGPSVFLTDVNAAPDMAYFETKQVSFRGVPLKCWRKKAKVPNAEGEKLRNYLELTSISECRLKILHGM